MYFLKPQATDLFRLSFRYRCSSPKNDASQNGIFRVKDRANKKKHQKKSVIETARAYSKRLRAEIDAERKKLGKNPIGDLPKTDPPSGGTADTTEKTVSTTDRDGKRVDRSTPSRCAGCPCKKRKQTIERVFADAKEKHAMRYTHYRGLAAVSRWVRLKYAAMSLKKPANRSWRRAFFGAFRHFFARFRFVPPLPARG